MNFAETLVCAAATHPERIAVSADGRSVTYAELHDAAARVAGMLVERGLDPGDVVAVMLTNGPELPACYFGALLAGATVTTLNPMLREGEVERLMRDSGARFFVGDADGAIRPAEAQRARPLDAPVERTGDEAAVLVYSSGTTGDAKAAEMTHSNLDAVSAAVLSAIGDWADTPAALCAAPFFQGFGQGCGMNAMVRAGASIFTFERFDAARTLALLEEHRIPMLQAVPTMCHDILNLPELRRRDVSRLRLCLTGGAAMPVDLLERVERELGCEVLEGYGLTEAYRVAMNRPGRRRPGSIGLPLPGVEVRIVDPDGELWIRGPNVMRGYWRNPEATARVIRDGWLRTRDVAYVDDDGYLFVVGRVDDVITRGGYKVHPAEVERTLREHPSVADAAVVAVPDERLGSEVGAAVIPAAGHEVDADELAAYVRARIAPYKYPRVIWSVQDLPRGVTGKVLRRQIPLPQMAVSRGESA